MLIFLFKGIYYSNSILFPCCKVLQFLRVFVFSQTNFGLAYNFYFLRQLKKLFAESILSNCFRTAGKTEHWFFFFFNYLKIRWHREPAASVACKNCKDSHINKNTQVCLFACFFFLREGNKGLGLEWVRMHLHLQPNALLQHRYA